jgi:hypothetical protein
VAARRSSSSRRRGAMAAAASVREKPDWWLGWSAVTTLQAELVY